MLEINSEHAVVRGVLPLVAGTLVFWYLVQYVFLGPKVFDAPTPDAIKTGSGVNAAATNTMQNLKTNYRQYRDRFFKIQEPHGDTVILPLRYLEELKALPQSTLSFQKATNKRLLGEYTGLGAIKGQHPRAFATSVTQNLTRNLSALMKVIHEECNYAFEQEIGPCEDWTEVNIFSKLVPIVALISGRVFIGPEMNRDPEYMRCIIKYTLEVFVSVGALQQIHPWLRGLYTYMGWIPELRQVQASQASMQQIMEPIIQQRLDAIAAGEELPNDMVTWNMMNSPPRERASIMGQAHSQLLASMAAIHTTSMTGAHVLYDIAARPQYIKPLRSEVEAVLAQESVPYLSKSSTPKLKLLDSFCKESQRMNPLGALTFNRLVQRDITLHDGTVLPAGTHLAVASAQRAGDEQLYEDPASFDPYRFLRFRQQPGHESRHQFVTTSPDELQFGYGAHACPGRFFANNELKVIFSYVLMHYDLKMPEGEGRPANIPTAGGSRPDVSKVLLMRKRRDLPA